MQNVNEQNVSKMNEKSVLGNVDGMPTHAMCGGYFAKGLVSQASPPTSFNKAARLMSKGSCSGKNFAGFTLIEIMIVVVIIGVLAAIALPNYQNYVRRSHVSAGQAYLLELAQRVESFRIDNGGYPTAVGTTLPTPPGLPMPAEVLKGYGAGSLFYNSTGITFQLNLNPVAGSLLEKAPEPVRLIITNAGQKCKTAKKDVDDGAGCGQSSPGWEQNN